MQNPLSANTRPYAALATLLVFLMLAIVLIFQPGLTGPYTFDDILIFPSTQLTEMNTDSVRQTLAMHNSGIFGRPLTIITQILNFHYMGPDPSGYKAVNLVLHCFNTLLIALLSFALLGHLNKRLETHYSNNFLIICTVLAAALWSLHPLQISTVHYIFQRSVLLSSFFTLLALLLYCGVRSKSRSPIIEFFTLFVAIPVLILMAIFSKENGVLILPMIVLLELTVFAAASSNVRLSNVHKAFILFILILPAILAVTFFLTHSSEIMEHYDSRNFSLLDRLRTESVVMFFYTKLILLPNIDEMSLYHDAYPVFRQWDILPASAALGIGLAIFAFVYFRKRAPIASFGIGLFLIAHSLESTFIPLELVFEHRNYIAMYGLILPALWYGATIARRYKLQRYASLLSVFVLMILSLQTHSRSIEWSDELTMNSIAVQNQPESLRARKIYAVALSNHHEFEQAFAQINKTIELHPTDLSARILKVALICNSQIDDQTPYDEALVAAGQLPLSQDVVAVLQGLLSMARDKACERLNMDYLEALATELTNNESKVMKHAYTMTLYALQAQIQLHFGKQNEILHSMEIALKFQSDHPEILAVLTSLYIQTNQTELAMKHLNELKKVNKRNLNAFQNLVDGLQADASVLSTENSSY